MRPTGHILLLLCAWCAPAVVAAQTPAATPQSTELSAGEFSALPDSVRFRLFLAEKARVETRLAEPFRLQWPLHVSDPIRNQPLSLGQRLQNRAQEQMSIIARPQQIELHSSMHVETGLWKAKVGNITFECWSDYPNRALDARALRFPMRRDLSPDHRTPAQKQAELLRKTGR